MADLRLSGKNIGILKDFDIELGKFTLISGECGSGKTTLLKALSFLTEAGAGVDENVFMTLLEWYADLSKKIEDRVRERDLPDDRKKEISEILWDEGIEAHMDEFHEEGLVTDEEYGVHEDVSTHDFFRYEAGDDRFLSDLVADDIEDAIDIEFPYVAECGNDGKRVMRLEGFEPDDEHSGDVAEVVLSEECELEKACVPYAPESIYLSATPIVDRAGYSEEDEDDMSYRLLEDRAYYKVTEAECEEEEYDTDEEYDEAEDFQAKLETALESFLMDTVRGSYEYDEDEDEFIFYRDEDGEGFDLECMPASYKAVADLALLIRRRAIKPDTILIVDGLDQTMSPAWKTCLAEFLVTLSRIADIRVVAASMSSEFIEAVTYFVDEYLDEDDFRCYMTDYDEEWKASTVDVTDDFEPLTLFLYGEDDGEEDYEDDEFEDDGESSEDDE